MICAAIYIRTACTLRDDPNLADQLARAEAFAARQGWDVVAIFRDAGQSGNRFDRPGLQALITAVFAGDIDVIVVTDLDRLARGMATLELTLQALDGAYVDLAAVSAPQLVPSASRLSALRQARTSADTIPGVIRQALEARQ